jgi:polyferredoxin
MGIDIRRSAHQIECIHCGECIDACQEVLGRLGRPTLIDYTWGKTGTSLAASTEPWYKRLGLRDAKRVVVLLVLVFYASGLAVALSLREQVLVQVTPDRGRLSWTGIRGETINRYRVTLANRGTTPVSVAFSLDGFPEGQLRLDVNPVRLPVGETRALVAEVFVPAGAPAVSVRPITLRARIEPTGKDEAFASTFVMPTGRGATR